MKKICICVLCVLSALFVSCSVKEKKKIQIENINLTINDKKEGIHILTSNSGNITSILSYKNDALDGECVWYYNNGRIRSKIPYLLGKEDGMAYYFYESGVIEAFREWKEGKKIGYAMDYYDISGETKAALIYNSNGYLIKRKTFDTLGNLISDEGG